MADFKIDNKVVKSITINGKNVTSLNIDGKKIVFSGTTNK